MQHASVKRLFKEQLAVYSDKNQYKSSPLMLLVLTWLKGKRKTNKVKICEFGGGAGQLLVDLQKFYPNANFTNVEIINEYKRFLTSKNIKFVVGSVLDPNFPDNSFDIVIMRDVLHHLIGRNYTETICNQRLALQQLKRLVKPGGAIFIEELTNDSEISTRVIYFLTRFNSKLGMRLPLISPHVIVSFLTPKKLMMLCAHYFGNKNIKKEILEVRAPGYVKLLHVLGKLEKSILTINKD